MATTFEVLYLGTGPEIDTTEGNVLSENAGALVGTTYGSSSDPLAFGAQRVLSPVDYSGGSSTMYDIDNTLSNDTFSIDGGPPQTFDGLAVYEARISYTDGTPDAKITAVVIQDSDGNLYLVPESSANADQAALTAAPIESLTLDAVFPISSGRFLADRQQTDFVCYGAGVMIETAAGEMPVECLKPGHRVATLDRGNQTVRWVRHGTQPLDDVAEVARPVLISRGALGAGIPERDLIVSPQHRLFVGGEGQLCSSFDTETMVPAKALTGLRGIRHMNGKRRITWVHFACDRHEVVRANGCWSESLLLGPVALGMLSLAEKSTLKNVFGPENACGLPLNGPPARPVMTVGRARRRLRHLRPSASAV